MLKNLDKYRLIPFVQYFKLWVTISFLVILVGFGFMFKNQAELGHPFFLGIDFTGGSYIQLKLPQAGDTQTITGIVKKYSVGEPWVQLRSEDPREVEIRVNIDVSEAKNDDARASRLRVEKFARIKSELAAIYGGSEPGTSPEALSSEESIATDKAEGGGGQPSEPGDESESTQSGETAREETGASKATEATEEKTSGEDARTSVPAAEEPTGETSPGSIEELSFDYVGPVVGRELIRNAILALLLGSVGIMIYIFVRFNRFVFALGAVVALLHDVLVTLAGSAIFRLEINGFFIAVILTIIGYSINDTIIIYDRIRENLKNLPQLNLATNINLSVTQTLTRSLATVGTVEFILLALLIWGGRNIYDFTMAMMFGMIAGSYSSVFIAPPIVLWLGREKTDYARIPARINLLAAQEQAVLGTWEEEESEAVTAEGEPAPPPGEVERREAAPAAAPTEERGAPGRAPAPERAPERPKKKRKKPRRR